MQWSDAAILLSARPQGEKGLTLSILTPGHGRHKGLMRSIGRGDRGLYQPGAYGMAHWQARLSEHLGQARLEVETSVAAGLLDDPLRLGCLGAAVSLADAALPERAPYPVLFHRLRDLLQALACDRNWGDEHMRWELSLLSELGYGLALDSCAVTGVTSDLAYVSPNSGRAVSEAAGAPYREKLLPLPRRLGGTGRAGAGEHQDLLDGLALTGFFLAKRVLSPFGMGIPEARTRYVDRLRRIMTVS